MIHADINSENGRGEYKHHDYVTGREEVGAAPEDVAEEMTELLNELKDIPAEKTLTLQLFSCKI